MTDSIAYLLEATIQAGKRDELEAMLKEFAEATQADPKAMNYEFFINGDDFRAFERFSDSAGALGHLEWFGENAAERFLAVATITKLSVFGNPSDELRGGMDAFGAQYFEPIGGFLR